MSQASQPKNSTRQLVEGGELLVSLIYLQAFLLILTYSVGVWQALVIQEAAVTSPIVMLHGFLAASFAVVSGTVGVLARLRGFRGIYLLNVGLFLVAIFGGSTGWIFLGNPTTANMDLINLAMTATIGVGIPITGISLAKVANSLGRIRTDPKDLKLKLVYAALASISFHVLFGVTSIFSALFGTIWYVHFVLAFFTGVLIIASLFISLRKSASARFFILAALVFVWVSGTGGILFIRGGPFYDVIVMAESMIFVYGFLIMSIEKY